MKILELELVPSEGYEIMNEKYGNWILNSYLVNFWTHQNLFSIIQNGIISYHQCRFLRVIALVQNSNISLYDISGLEYAYALKIRLYT